MPREHPCFSEPFTWAQVNDVLTKRHRRLINRLGWAICQTLTFGLPPELVHGIEFGRSRRQKPQLDVQNGRVLLASRRGMRRAPIFKQDDLPAAPLAPDHFEKSLMSRLVPCFSNEQGHRTRLNVQHAMNNAPRVIARNGNTGLLSDMPIATVKRWRLSDNGFV